jgi:putative DNA primase/helicase
MEVVSLKQLQALASTLPKAEPTGGQRNGQADGFDLEAFIGQHLDVHHHASWKQGGHRWILNACPFNSDHGEKSAWVARQPNGAIAAGCQHYSCTWKWPELRERFEPKPARQAQQDSKSGKAQGGYFDQQGQLIVPTLGHEIEQAGHLAVGIDGQLYRYHHGAYRPDGETFVRTQVRAKLGRDCRRSHFGEVLAWTTARFPTVTTWPPEQWINCANGLLDWRTGNLEPHTPDVISTVQLPVSWDTAATCPEWDKFTARMLASDITQLVEEVAGYCLIPGNRFRKAILLLGPTGTGKSKALAAIRGLLGPANVSATTLQAFAENRFAAADLFGKLANIAGDLDARSVDRSDTFKMVTGGDPIQAERKFGQPFSFTPFAKLLFSANEPPLSADQTDAWFARWLIIPFEEQIPEAEQDGDLEAKLTTPAELSGLLVRAVEGLRRLMKRGRFEEPDAVQKASSDYRDRLDSVRGFISEECVLLLDAHIARSKLYKSYAKWCNDGGRHPLGRERFHDSIRRNWAGEVIEQTIRGTREFKGIGLKSTDSEGGQGAAPWI